VGWSPRLKSFRQRKWLVVFLVLIAVAGGGAIVIHSTNTDRDRSEVLRRRGQPLVIANGAIYGLWNPSSSAIFKSRMVDLIGISYGPSKGDTGAPEVWFYCEDGDVAFAIDQSLKGQFASERGPFTTAMPQTFSGRLVWFDGAGKVQKEQAVSADFVRLSH
jgi:hypothetical protein